MKKVSILNLAEDLLEDDSIKATLQAKSIQGKRAIGKRASFTKPKTLETLILDVAKTLEIDPQELHDWITEHSVPNWLLKPILLTAQQLGLNPLLGYLAWELTPEGTWEVYLPIDAWIALIHREPKFQGMTFNQSNQTENSIPIWMECSIYRSDLIHPITVREYFIELKTEHPMWAQMPRRMLRHKTLQQCALLAFGITRPKFNILRQIPTSQKVVAGNYSQGPLNRKELLKQKLNMHNFMINPCATKRY